MQKRKTNAKSRIVLVPIAPRANAKSRQFPFNPEDSFIATIFASDHRSVFLKAPVPAGYAVALQKEVGNIILGRLALAVDKEQSSHNEALVFAVQQIVNVAPPNTSITVRTTSEYIVRTLNEWLGEWSANGWTPKQGRKLKQASLWKEIHTEIEHKHLAVVGEHIGSDEAKASLVLKVLEKLAVEARNQHGLSIGAPMSGFEPQD